MDLEQKQKQTHIEGTAVYMKHVWPQWFRAFERATGPGSRILTAGCGTGGLLSKLYDPGRKVVGCDLDFQALRSARVYFPVCQADLEALPFRSGQLDFITCEWVLEHLSNTAKALSELARVARPGGHVLLMATNPNSPLGLVARLFPHAGAWVRKRSLGIDEDHTWETKHVRSTLGAVTRTMAAHGCTRVGLRRISHMEFYVLHSPLLRPVVKAYDALFRIPPFSALANAYLAVFRKGPV